jgi:hypothetical protein
LVRAAPLIHAQVRASIVQDAFLHKGRFDMHVGGDGPKVYALPTFRRQISTVCRAVLRFGRLPRWCWRALARLHLSPVIQALAIPETAAPATQVLMSLHGEKPSSSTFI